MNIDNHIDNSLNKKTYGNDTIYIMSYVKIPESTPVGIVYGFVAIGFIINYRTDTIEDSSITFLSDEVKRFFKDLTVGYDLGRGIEELVNVIKLRLHVASQKSICVALRDIDTKYRRWKQENIDKLQAH
ncbi:MAG: DUF3870 domain-containing protein [Eubacteriales bacterium]|nr:DUF3870 domain-containing protein [Eubacteriales bacterium]